MESPPGSPFLDEEDIVPCKGCGNVLEEGKAFELAGNRWHIDCFRCNSCGTLLDSDANLLLLGDGSLICNSCTYSCTACGNKIEDLAILTGDQAFCAGCFRCRNCKRKIENLKYARTSQGIFCMNCHESLMARRRKRQKPTPQRTPTSSTASPMLSLDKSLPSLPVEDDSPVSISHDTMPTELSARPSSRPQASRSNSGKTTTTPDQLSPMSAYQQSSDHLRTPRTNKRHSQISLGDGTSGGFIPLVFDDSLGLAPAAPLPSTSYNRSGGLHHDKTETVPRNPLSTPQYESERERSSRPHIATQDRSYDLQVGLDIPRHSRESEQHPENPGTRGDSSQRKQDSESLHPQEADIAPANGTRGEPEKLSNSFKLGEVPSERKRSVGAPRSPDAEESRDHGSSSSRRIETPQKSISPDSLPPRGDSFRPPQPRTDVSTAAKGVSSDSSNALVSSPSRSRHAHAASGPSTFGPESTETRRPLTAQDSGFSPSQSESNNSEISPSLPPLAKTSLGGLGFDEEIKRVFGGGSNDSILRRVSNSVKHGRSLSEATRQSPKWPRSPGSATYTPQFGEITAPLSPDGREDVASLKLELRRSTQRIAELEAKLNNNESAKQLEHNIQEKRNTVALLETEREAFLRELMVIKERLDASKEGKPLNFEELKSDLIRGLTRELESLKETLKADIQILVVQRDQLMEDVESFGRLREQAIQETEQLNMKNAQLADLNNELTRRIQGQFQANKHQVPGLGIFDVSNPDLLSIKDLDKRPTNAIASVPLATIGVPYSETSEGPEVFVAQKIAPFKNGAQQKKFFWKKPGATIMKGANKINRVFAAESQEGASAIDGTGTKSQGSLPKKWGKNTKGPINGSAGASQEVGGHVPIFGGDLELRTVYENVKIPAVVQKCIQEVEMRGMDYEGIYRKSGGSTQMKQIQDEFERGDDVQFSPDLDICTVTSVLKQYFRNLPNPLITYEVYDRFVETSNIYEEDKRVESLKAITEDLPQAHRDVLQFIIFHLARVAARKDENLMNTRNLAVVFAPTLVRHLSDEREMSDMHSKNNAVQFLIDFNESIF